MKITLNPTDFTIIGPTGGTGPRPTGPSGTTGPSGASGPTGGTGPSGASGPTGGTGGGGTPGGNPSGPSGASGPTGPTHGPHVDHEDEEDGPTGPGLGDDEDGPTGPSGTRGPEWTIEDLERANQKARGSGERTSDKSKVESMKDKPKIDVEKTDKGRGRSGKGHDENVNVWDKVNATISWDKLLEKMIGGAATAEETYLKANKRAVTNTHQQAHGHAVPAKPGIVEQPGQLKKILFVIDCSGSMMGSMAKVYASIDKMLHANHGQMASSFVLIKFSDSYHIFLCEHQRGRGRYTEIASAAQLREAAGKLESGDVKKLFETTYGSTTNFSKALVTELEVFLKQGFNVLVLTDPDIGWQDNAENIRYLFKRHKKQVFIVTDTVDSFRVLCGILKEVNQQITHL